MTALTKPVRRIAQCRVPHGIKPQLVLTLFPGGVISIREARRAKSYEFDLGMLYAQAVHQEAMRQRPRRAKK